MRNKKGISLIVLVITIIVMIILAASVVITLSNTGVINKANSAVNTTNAKEVEQYVQLLWSEAYIEGEGKWTAEEIQEYIDDKLSDDIKASYTITATEKGVTVTSKDATSTPSDTTVSGGWELAHTLDGTKVTAVNVTNGDVTIPVGTTIDYTVDGYTGAWKVLGVDEYGRLKIMTAANVVASKTLGSDDDIEVSKTDYANVVTTLNSLCDGLDEGTKAVADSARSVKVEDIDEITKYDKTTYQWNTDSDGNKTTPKQLYAYGNEVTYSWQGTNYPLYTYGTSSSGTLTGSHASGFTYYKDGVWTTSALSTTATASSPVEITTLTSDYYYYTGSTYLDSTTDAYAMLFSSGNYWLASRYVYAGAHYVFFGVRYVYSGVVGNNYLCYSLGLTYGGSYAVRAAVSLESDVQVEYDASTKTCTIK